MVGEGRPAKTHLLCMAERMTEEDLERTAVFDWPAQQKPNNHQPICFIVHSGEPDVTHQKFWLMNVASNTRHLGSIALQ